jgi:quercetin dioxygenase-like cupin family protein
MLKFSFAGIAALVCAGLILSQGTLQLKPTWLRPTDIRWGNGPPSLEKGAKAFGLEGNPTMKGLFSMRVSLPPGFRIMPHTHSQDEHVTVISGTYGLGIGDRFDVKMVREFPAGSFLRTTAGIKHFAYTRTGCVIQMHGIGPWDINYLNLKDDPRKRMPEKTSPSAAYHGNMKTAATLLAVFAATSMALSAGGPEPASKLIENARKEAATKKKNIFVVFDASW